MTAYGLLNSNANYFAKSVLRPLIPKMLRTICMVHQLYYILLVHHEEDNLRKLPIRHISHRLN